VFSKTEKIIGGTFDFIVVSLLTSTLLWSTICLETQFVV